MKTSPACFDALIIVCDGMAHTYFEKSYDKIEFHKLNGFLKDEFVYICDSSQGSKFEVIDRYGNLVHPFKGKAHNIMLSPNFFNKGYKLLIDDSSIDLTMERWKSAQDQRDLF